MLQSTTKSLKETWKKERRKEIKNLKLDMIQKMKVSELLLKALSWEHTPFSNMIHLMKNANNFMPDRRRSLLLPLKMSHSTLMPRKNAELD